MSTSKKTIYLAGPLFTERQRERNILLAQAFFHAGFDVYLPQVDTGAAEYDERGNCINSVKHKDLMGLEKCDVVVASFWDGFIDEGTCYEVGYAEAKNIPVVILSDDHRPMRNEMFSAIVKVGTTSSCIDELCNRFHMEREDV